MKTHLTILPNITDVLPVIIMYCHFTSYHIIFIIIITVIPTYTMRQTLKKKKNPYKY